MGAGKYQIIEECFTSESDLTSFSCIEIGSERGEGSTSFFARFCARGGMEFWTCDFDPSIADNARMLTSNVVCAKGEDWLRSSPPQRPVVFAYLDNFDWVYPKRLTPRFLPSHLAQSARYSQIDGSVLNNTNSQAAHLTQSQLLMPLFAEHAFVLFDDTWRYESGGYDGKGGLAVPFLLDRGFHIISQKISPDGQGDTFDGWVLVGR